MWRSGRFVDTQGSVGSGLFVGVPGGGGLCVGPVDSSIRGVGPGLFIGTPGGNGMVYRSVFRYTGVGSGFFVGTPGGIPLWGVRSGLLEMSDES